MGTLLSKSKTPKPSDRSSGDIRSSLTKVTESIREVSEFTGDLDDYSEAFRLWNEEAGTGSLNIQSCNANANFLAYMYCGPEKFEPDPKKVKAWTQKNVYGNGEDSPPTGKTWDGVDVDSKADEALSSACALIISVSNPDHHWIVVPTSRGMMIQMSYEGLFDVTQWVAAGGEDLKTKNDVTANVRGLASSNFDARKRAFLWFCFAKSTQVEASLTDENVIQLEAVNWRPLKT